ncbi:MAG: hypothetical protein GTO30_21155 [Acidobacteria bacterium]|nr:hypothetical protein [Acidobacteriota bacterium]NIQ85359.1 hypothetical protein [Acidobacteriota bacterium]
MEYPDLPEVLRSSASSSDGIAPGTLREMEARRISEALRDAGGNKKLAARKLGIHRSTLYAKMRRYGLLERDVSDDESSLDSQHDESETATLVPTH